MTSSGPSSVRLSPETEERLEKIAAVSGRSKSYLIRESVDRMVDQLEWEYQVLQTAREISAGKQRTYSSEEVAKLLGLSEAPSPQDLEDIS